MTTELTHAVSHARCTESVYVELIRTNSTQNARASQTPLSLAADLTRNREEGTLSTTRLYYNAEREA